MKTEVTLVTAFFDIKRGEWKKSNIASNQYISYFASWARIKNKIVIYTDAETAELVKRIRSDYGLLDKTIIIVINDYLSLDFELYSSIKKSMEAPNARYYHLKPDHPESWSPEYNYVMLLKWWCVNDAINKGYTNGYTAWVDFGFNKSGLFYTKPDEFDFLWEPELKNKVYLFCINELDDIPIYEIIQRMDTYIQGCSIVGEDNKWVEFASLMRQSMIELNDCGLCDDDQVVMLMSYRKKPDIFELVFCPWFGMFYYLGCDNLTIRSNHPKTNNIISSFKAYYQNNKRKYQYRKSVRALLKKQKTILMKKNTIRD